MFDGVADSVPIPAAIPVSCEPSPKYVTTPTPSGPTVPPVPILIPRPAVTRPTEFTLVTSSYEIVPATETVSAVTS